MRTTISLAAGLVLLVTAPAGWAQNVGLANQGANQGGQGSLNFTGMAQQIFKQSDRNHNSVLNRSEFSTAQLLTDSTIANLGRSGLIGRGRALNLGQSLTGRHRQMQILGQAGGLGGIGVRNAGLGGLRGANAGMLGTTITNTNHVTPPQFTSYFLSSVANADAALRNMYANMRRGNGRTYARYGRGYGHRPYYGYGHQGYAYSRPRSNPTTALASSHPGSASTPSTTGGQTPTANSSATAAKSILTGGGGGPINAAALGATGEIAQPHFASSTTGSTGTHHSHAAGQTNHKSLASSQSRSATASSNAANSNAAQVRARITAMAQARAKARNTAYSGGGGGAPMNFSGGGGHPGGGGGHPGGGGGQHHAGGGGGGHHGHR